MYNYRKLPLCGLSNARDLGGFASNRGVTKFGVFLRADVPAFLSVEDKALLREYDLKHVIDLRSAREFKAVPDVLSFEKDMTYTSIPMYDDIASNGAIFSDNSGKEFSWAEHYIRMVENNKPWMLEVMTALCKEPGCVMFHCATGKDRTGLISMAVLGLCGVSDEDITADYSVSQIYLRSFYEKMFKAGRFKSPKEPFLLTAPENMEGLLKHINSVYGGIPSYLKTCGVSDDIAETLRNRLEQVQ